MIKTLQKLVMLASLQAAWGQTEEAKLSAENEGKKDQEAAATFAA